MTYHSDVRDEHQQQAYITEIHLRIILFQQPEGSDLGVPDVSWLDFDRLIVSYRHHTQTEDQGQLAKDALVLLEVCIAEDDHGRCCIFLRVHPILLDLKHHTKNQILEVLLFTLGHRDQTQPLEDEG